MKMYLDIETIPAEEKDKEALLDIYTRRVEKSKKDPGSFEEFLESTNFDGSFGRICCISYALDNEPAKSLSGDEKQMLIDFWNAARGIQLFVGFNIIDFDMRFIYQRSFVLGVKPTQDLSFARYRSAPMYDVMKEWAKWGNATISLHALSKAMGIRSSKEGDIEGKDVAQAYKDGRLPEICKYCEADVEVTRQLYKRMIFEN